MGNYIHEKSPLNLLIFVDIDDNISIDDWVLLFFKYLSTKNINLACNFSWIIILLLHDK